MKIVLWFTMVACMFTTAALAAPNTDLIISDYENQSDLARYEIKASTPLPKFTLTTEHSSHGAHAARIFFPKWQPNTDKWPSIILTAEKGLPGDWTNYDSLTLDVYNASSDHLADFYVYLQDKGKHRTSLHYFIPAEVSQTVRVDLDSLPNKIDLANMDALQFTTPRSSDENDLIIDYVRLESSIRPHLKEAGNIIAQLRRNPAAGSSELKPMLNSLEQTYQNLSRHISKSTQNNLKSDISTLDERINAATRAVDEADMRSASSKINPNLPYACGFTNSMEKVFPRDIPFHAQLDRYGEISLAGNEVESIQLLILAADHGLKDIRVETGRIIRTDGKSTNTYPTLHVSPVGFVKTEKPPYHVRYVGWYPDPILDFLKSFDVKPHELQPVWIRVQTPPGTPAGEYIANIIVKPANAAPARLGLKINVWGFDLPRGTHLLNAMSLCDGYLSQTYGQAAADEMRIKYQDFSLRYHINPTYIYSSNPPKIEDVMRWDKQGLNAFNIFYINKLKDIKAGEPYPEAEKQKIMAKLDAFIPQLKEKGLYDKAYIYGFDEINPDTFDAMKDIFTTIKAKYPDLRLMTTARDDTYGAASSLDCIDIWVPLAPKYDVARAKQARERGKKVWWYICISPKEPYANWLIEYDAIDARSLMGLQTVKYQPDGFLYYATMRWPLTRKPITNGPYTDWPTASYETNNGDGSVICAGPDGPLATIRLENIRDGIEDYEYFRLLQDEVNRLKGHSDPESVKVLNQAEKALKIGDDLVKDMTHFNKSPEALYTKRAQVAEAIIEIRKITKQ